MISAEVRFADCGLLEIAGPTVETKKLILLGKKKIEREKERKK